MTPFYYRFAFDPQTGAVELSHNEEEKTRYHTDLAQTFPGDSYHGYAYRIVDGWRLTDWEHNPITDRFIISSVVRALRQKEHPLREASAEEWEPGTPGKGRYNYNTGDWKAWSTYGGSPHHFDELKNEWAPLQDQEDQGEFQDWLDQWSTFRIEPDGEVRADSNDSTEDQELAKLDPRWYAQKDKWEFGA